MNYSDKLRQTNHEAVMTLFALLVVIVVWLVCGFGLSSVDIRIWHIPLWVWGGLFGTWIAAIICSVVLARKFSDFNLDDDCENNKAAEGDGGTESVKFNQCADDVMGKESSVKNVIAETNVIDDVFVAAPKQEQRDE